MRDALINHYGELTQLAEQDLTTTTSDMNAAEPQASPDVLVRHQRIFKSTKHNVNRRMQVRRQTSNGKLDRLYLERHNNRRPRTDAQEAEPELVVSVTTQEDPAEESYVVQTQQTAANEDEDRDVDSQGGSSTTEIMDVVTVDSPTRESPIVPHVVTPHRPTTRVDTIGNTLHDSTAATDTTHTDSGLGTSSRDTAPHVMPQRTTKVVRRRKHSPKRFTRPTQGHPAGAISTHTLTSPLNPPTSQGPTQTSTQVSTPQQHLRVSHLPAFQGRPSRVSTRSIGTDPKDPSVFPLARQKTLLCYERRKKPMLMLSRQSPQIRPRSSSGSRLSSSSNPSLPTHSRSHSNSRLYSEVACQTQSPSSGQVFRH